MFDWRGLLVSGVKEWLGLSVFGVRLIQTIDKEEVFPVLVQTKHV